MKLKKMGNVKIRLSRKELNDLIPNHFRGEKKKRVCLMCKNVFNSQGAFNRRCSKCNNSLKKYKPHNFDLPKIYKLTLQELSNYHDSY